MRILIAGIMCLLASSASASVFNDVIESLAERAAEASISSEVEVVELFHAETPEELEAALTDGYPMPWLEEILNDESIPEEDRYWLDCRVRAHVAKYLHRFYDRDGNPVEVEAEWISPGEHYWQEHLMVNPVGEDYGFGETPDYLPDFTGEPGTIMNLYGEQTGEMALTQRGIIMSRDGSIGVLKTGPADIFTPPPYALNYVCLIYSDGTFREIETDFIREWEHITVSQDGELIVACCIDMERDRPNGYIQAFDKEGNTLFTTEIGGTAAARPAISPDNRYIAVPLQSPIPRSIVILDATTGELLRRFQDLWANQVAFSPDGERTAYAGSATGVGVLDLYIPVDGWNYNVVELRSDNAWYSALSLCSVNNLIGLYIKTGRSSYPFYTIVQNSGEEVFRSEASNLDLSPNGRFAMCFNSRRAYPSEYEPSFITIVSIRERG